MDLTSNIEFLSVADVPTLSKAAFVLSSKTVIRSQISCLDADREFKGILSTKKVALHSTRLKFINWCATTFVALYREELHGVGNCTIVTAEVGTGKSFLLKNIAAATVDLVPSTIVCYIQYKVVKSSTPLAMLIDLMKVTYQADWNTVNSVAELHVHMDRLKYNVVFFIDGLDAVFARGCDESAAIINQLLAISEMDCSTRRIIVVAAGSPCLRRLCFGTASNDDRLRYPTYSGKDFNGRKYAYHTMGTNNDSEDLIV